MFIASRQASKEAPEERNVLFNPAEHLAPLELMSTIELLFYKHSAPTELHVLVTS
jgi:hypothetical protein